MPKKSIPNYSAHFNELVKGLQTGPSEIVGGPVTSSSYFQDVLNSGALASKSTGPALPQELRNYLEESDKPNVGSKIIDFLLRGAAATGGVIQNDLKQTAPGDVFGVTGMLNRAHDTGSAWGNPIEGLKSNLDVIGSALAGDTHVMPSQAFNEKLYSGAATSTGEKIFRGVTGFAMDVAFDPLSAVNPAKAVRGAVNISRAARGLDPVKSAAEIRRLSTLAPETERLIKEGRTPEQIASAVEHGEIQSRFAKIKESLPEVTAPVTPQIVPSVGKFSQRVQAAEKLMKNNPKLTYDDAFAIADDTLSAPAGEFSKRAAEATRLMDETPGMAYEDAWLKADQTLTPPMVGKEAPALGGMAGAFGFKGAPDVLMPAVKAVEEAPTVAEVVVPKLKSKLSGAFDFKGLPDNLLPSPKVAKADEAIQAIEDTAKSIPTEVPASIAPDIARGIEAAKNAAAATGAHGNAAQANAFIRLRNDVVKTVKAADIDKSLTSFQRNKLIKDQTLAKLKAVEEAASAAGASHFARADPGSKMWAIKGSDVIETLSEAVVKRHITGGAANVHFTAVMRGVAKALDLMPITMGKTAKISEIATAMKKGGLSGHPMSLTSLANELYHKAPQLLDRVTTNEARMGLKAGQDIPLLTEKAMQDIHAALLSEAPAAIVHAITDAPKAVTKMGEEIGAEASSVAAAVGDVAEGVAKTVDDIDFLGITAAKRQVHAIEVGDAAAARKIAAATIKEVEKVAIKAAEASGAVLDDVTKYQIGQWAAVNSLARIRPSQSQIFKSGKELELNIAGAAGHDIGVFNGELNQLGKRFSTEQLQAEMSIIKQGGKSSVPEFQKLWDQVYGDESLFGPLFRNGAAVPQINHAFEQAFKGAAGSAPKFDEALAKTPKELADQWRNWKIDDPLDHLSRAYDAVRKLTSRQAVAITMENNFGHLVRKPGMVKIAVPEESFIASHLNPNMYYDPEVASAIDGLEWLAGASRNFKGKSGIGSQFIDKVYDPLLTLWKTYATIVRPANHIRNGVGDGLLNHMAGMNNLPRWYKGALDVMMGGKGGTYTQVVEIGGKKVTITGDEMMRDFIGNGLRPNYQVLEDLTENSSNKILGALQDNPLVRAGGNLSEKVSVTGKLAQYMHELSKPANIRAAEGDINKLKAIASREVRRNHPDASILSPGEFKYARRIVPFYSWLRGAVPLVAEATVTRPGRVTALPKASYNVAVQNGIDPHSVGQPFPEDVNYPSYMTNDLLGPTNLFGEGTGNYLGSPVESIFGDVLNTYGNSFSSPYNAAGQFQGIAALDSVSPLIKGPADLMFGTRLSTGKPILDRGEYFDQNIPLVSNFASISGYSPSGTITNALGFGPAKAPTIDPLRSVLRGEKQHWFNQAMVNFITGVGVKSFDNPSDLRNATREDRAQQAGQQR